MKPVSPADERGYVYVLEFPGMCQIKGLRVH
jgi:hypothetical protein